MNQTFIKTGQDATDEILMIRDRLIEAVGDVTDTLNVSDIQAATLMVAPLFGLLSTRAPETWHAFVALEAKAILIARNPDTPEFAMDQMNEDRGVILRAMANEIAVTGAKQ